MKMIYQSIHATPASEDENRNFRKAGEFEILNYGLS